MPWKVRDVVTERMRFVTRLLDGERMTDVCREFGISRKTGYKIWNRFQADGVDGLENDSRRPRRSPLRTPRDIVELIVSFRRQRPSWGPKKIRSRLQELHPGVKIPASSTIGVILKREGLVKPRRRKRRVWPSPTPLRASHAPNEIWSMDFKGQFRLGNQQYCYPLTVCDHYSRYLLGCEALERPKGVPVESALRSIFREYGLPQVIRTDNGSPFASTTRLGWTRLSVWLLRHGIALERIQPAHPEQNGRHERFHLTLKRATTRPAQRTMLQQQERFDLFQQEYNQERPHEALEMRKPAELYECSSRPYRELKPLEYPLHDFTLNVYEGGTAKFPRGPLVYVSKALAEERIGIRELGDDTWLVSFIDEDIGYVDTKTRQFLAHPPDLCPIGDAK